MADSPEYERGWHDSQRENQRWVLVLDRHQRDNLLSLINIVGFPHSGLPPFDVLNSGDWLAEIAHMLADVGTPAAFQMLAEATGDPLLTRETAAEKLAAFLRSVEWNFNR